MAKPFLQNLLIALRPGVEEDRLQSPSLGELEQRGNSFLCSHFDFSTLDLSRNSWMSVNLKRTNFPIL